MLNRIARVAIGYKISFAFCHGSMSLQKGATHMRMHACTVGKRQTIETLINEEALLLAKFLRDERKTWTPRIACMHKIFERDGNDVLIG